MGCKVGVRGGPVWETVNSCLRWGVLAARVQSTRAMTRAGKSTAGTELDEDSGGLVGTAW